MKQNKIKIEIPYILYVITDEKYFLIPFTAQVHNDNENIQPLFSLPTSFEWDVLVTPPEIPSIPAVARNIKRRACSAATTRENIIDFGLWTDALRDRN